MVEFTKPQRSIANIADGEGVWTKVVGFSKVDGQDGIWLSIENGDSCYYNPNNEMLQTLAFTACLNLDDAQVWVLLPSNAPAAGLIVGSGKNG